MKKYYFAFIAFCFLSFANGQIINFPDANFKAKLLAANSTNQTAKNLAGDYFKIDENNDGEIQLTEALQVIYINVTGIDVPANGKIGNLTGIEFFTNIKFLDCSSNLLLNLNMNNNLILETLICRGNKLTTINVSSNNLLLNLNCDTNRLSSLNLSNNNNLVELTCLGNLLGGLNLVNNAALKTLDCSANYSLSAIDLTNNLMLENLICTMNNLYNINLNNNNALLYLNCSRNNHIYNLNLNNKPNLRWIECEENQMTNLSISNCPNLRRLHCNNNSISLLVFDDKPLFEYLSCDRNLITNLDFSTNKFLNYLSCKNNKLINLNIKNGSISGGGGLYLADNITLKYICADENEMNTVLNLVNNASSNIYYANVNSYCSFTPGGVFYSITGNNKFDINLNGCDANDITIQNLKFKITNGINEATFISNSSGTYSIPVSQGIHTITPIIENSFYFNFLPSTATLNFPGLFSPFTQNFCVTANGVHNDLEVSLLPVNVARPGFDASYKLIYKNKGNQTQSGAVSLTFNDAVLDFVNANPATSSQTLNDLSWSFIDLKPFESREIAVTLNANSPMESPALNDGNILTFTANITSTNDETPNDNTAILNQTVFNSFDPNDKTCLEGNNIVPAKVGDYVHYMIRFENTGTFAAQNIVVKDMIDLAKFDIASLIPVKGSHDFYTRINGNKVEFIFENINLPFADATNDGYIAFKIKTKSTLILGNTFSNSASIYFDYNFPIVTNTATTTVSNSLATNDFEFSKYFNIYPNPAKDFLNLETKSGAIISSLSIYNTLGQLVQVITSPNKTIDVSELKSGNYFLKIVSDKGTSGSKFVKE